MYQHPAALAMNAHYHQEDALRNAKHHELEREATEGQDHHTPTQHRLVAAAVAVLLVVAAFALI